jgi:CRISPR-associated protein Cas2
MNRSNGGGEMYVVMVYDLEAERTQKALKIGRRYLTHVQNSVLEGEISEGDLAQLKNEIDDLLKPGESTIIYELSSDTLLNRAVYGEDPTEDQRFL